MNIVRRVHLRKSFREEEGCWEKGLNSKFIA
jgi:hypothetical protein